MTDVDTLPVVAGFVVAPVVVVAATPAGVAAFVLAFVVTWGCATVALCGDCADAVAPACDPDTSWFVTGNLLSTLVTAGVFCRTWLVSPVAPETTSDTSPPEFELAFCCCALTCVDAVTAFCCVVCGCAVGTVTGSAVVTAVVWSHRAAAARAAAVASDACAAILVAWSQSRAASGCVDVVAADVVFAETVAGSPAVELDPVVAAVPLVGLVGDAGAADAEVIEPHSM